MPGTSAVRHVFLRIGLGGVPPSAVERINDHVQYASNVVNLVIPGFGDARVPQGAVAFELESASKTFFQYFADAYDVLAFVPERSPVVDYVGAHGNVQNAVQGLGMDLFNVSRSYGSADVLEGVELYPAAHAALFGFVEHEMAHQWGLDFDWAKIAGVARANSSQLKHAPLWTGGETLIGAVLNPDRRVRTLSDGYDIERTPAPIHYHPIERYSMGAVGADQVPEFRVFVDQAQFNPDYAISPNVRTRVQGETRLVSISEIIRAHGSRIGPAPTLWRRATVLVSRDRLISQREMDYWNFLAQRLADRNHGVRPTAEGYVPFRAATNDAVTLTTTIQPRDRDALPETLNIDSPSFGATDWRDVEFWNGVPTRFRIGELVTLTGHVRATDPVDFTNIALAFGRVDGTGVAFYGGVRRNRDFSVTFRFTEGQEGQYYLGVGLVWRGGFDKYARTSLSSVSVEGTQSSRLLRRH